MTGEMLMFSSAEDPYVTLPQMRSYDSRVVGMMSGRYKLSGNRVRLVVNSLAVTFLCSLYKFFVFFIAVEAVME